eukprot:500067-Amphidinium_carterae.2
MASLGEAIHGTIGIERGELLPADANAGALLEQPPSRVYLPSEPPSERQQSGLKHAAPFQFGHARAAKGQWLARGDPIQ